MNGKILLTAFLKGILSLISLFATIFRNDGHNNENLAKRVGNVLIKLGRLFESSNVL